MWNCYEMLYTTLLMKMYLFENGFEKSKHFATYSLFCFSQNVCFFQSHFQVLYRQETVHMYLFSKGTVDWQSFAPQPPLICDDVIINF